MQKILFRRAVTALLSIALLVTLCIPFRATGVHAANNGFTDVTKLYWAAKSIEFASQHGIVNGYKNYDGGFSFKPEQNVTCEEAAVMLYRALKVSNSLKSSIDYSGEYSALFEKHQIAEYSRVAIAYLLKHEIINPAELAGFNKGIAKGNPAPRVQVASWIAKAMEKGFVGVFFVPYEDIGKIHNGEMQYVDLLYRYGIMKGSLGFNNKVSFMPKQGVKRSEFAAISNRVYDFSSSNEQFKIFNLTRDYVTYRNTISNIIFDQDAEIIYNGELISGVSALDKEQIYAISSVAVSRNKKPQVHIQSQPVLITGNIVAIQDLGSETELIDIKDSQGNVISYLKTPETKIKDGWVMLYEAKIMTFIVDGAKIVEFKTN